VFGHNKVQEIKVYKKQLLLTQINKDSELQLIK